MAIALTAWLMAPAPMAWTSTRCWVRTTPAMAPATATGLEVADTLRISIAGRGGRGGAAAALLGSEDVPVDPFDCCGVSRVSIYCSQDGIEGYGALRHLKPDWQARQEALQADPPIHADNGVPGTDHSQVRHIGGALGQDAGIGRGDVGVGAEHEAGPAVQVPAQRHLLGGGLGVHIHDPHPSRLAAPDDLVHGRERGVVGWHEEPALDVADQHHPLLPQVVAEPAAPWGTAGIVLGPQDWAVAVEPILHLALIPDVVAAGQDIDAQGEQVVRDLGGQPEPAGGIFAV